MHDGSIASLAAVLEHYNSNMEDQETLDPIFRKRQGAVGISLTPDEQTKILSFLKTLNDYDFIKDKRFSEQ